MATQANDKIRIRAGNFADERAFVIGADGPEFVKVRLAKDEKEVRVSAADIVNYSDAARRAWETMPKRRVGRPRTVTKQRLSVTLRLDEELWKRVQALESSGVINGRSEFLESLIARALKKYGA